MKIKTTSIIGYTGTLILLFLFLCSSIFAQVPVTLNYQAVLRDGTGIIKANTTASIVVTLHQGSDTGTEVYTESHNATTNSLGLVNLEIGSKDETNFALVDWSNGPYFVEIEVDGTWMGTSELLTVPYALYAVNGTPGPKGDQGDPGPQGEKGDPGDTKWEDITGGINYNLGNVGVGTSNPSEKLDVEGSVEIDGNYTYEAEKTRYYSLSSHHFTSNYPTVGLLRNNARFIYFSTGSGIAVASAGINLPDGAVVTSVTAYLLDSDPGENTTLYLRWYKHNGTFGTMASCATTDAESSAAQFIRTDNTIEDATINNSTTTYYLDWFGSASNSLIKLQSVKIAYTVSKAD